MIASHSGRSKTGQAVQIQSLTLSTLIASTAHDLPPHPALLIPEEQTTSAYLFVGARQGGRLELDHDRPSHDEPAQRRIRAPDLAGDTTYQFANTTT